MWTFIKQARLLIAGRAVRLMLAAVVATIAIPIATSRAAPVEYVRICDIFGVGFYYIPGTDTCQNANQIVDNQFAAAKAVTRASTATAMAASLVNPFLPDAANFAISTHWAVFNGQHALGIAGLMRLHGNLALTMGVGFGLDRGNLTTLSERRETAFGVAVASESWSEIRVMARFGLTYAW